MKIVAYYKNRTKHILVMDELEEEINQDDFLFEIADHHSKLEIVFIESRILPVRIIESLVKLKAQYGNGTFKIYTTTEALSQYLFELQIPNQQLQTSKQISPEQDSKNAINFSEEELTDLLRGIYKIYGHDFRNYQLQSLRRTFLQIMVKESLLDFKMFKEKILQDHEFFQRSFLNLSINVTSFFRDPDLFKVLREEVFPYLNSFPLLRIWIAVEDY